MPNVKHVATATDAVGLAETVAVDRTTNVSEQSALFPTRLALARWTMGGDFPHLHGVAAARLPLQSAWFASATRNFQEWIECGGFAQYDEGEVANEPGHQPKLFNVTSTPAPRPPIDDGAAERAGACMD
jgi:hypothetical protein